MKLIKQANSAHVLDIDDVQILFSYETPVAVWIVGSHFLVTETDYSRTTTGHIKQFVLDRTYKENVGLTLATNDQVEFVPQERINDALKETV